MSAAEITESVQVFAVIKCVSPEIDGVRLPARRIADGWHRTGEDGRTEVPMPYFENDRCAGMAVADFCQIEFTTAAAERAKTEAWAGWFRQTARCAPPRSTRYGNR